MFLHVPTLKKTMKQAWKNDKLTIGHQYNGLVIGCAEVVVWLRADVVPNKVKAAVMELCGVLPEVGEMFTAGETGNQSTMADMRDWDLPRLARRGYRYTVTPVISSRDKYTAYRLLQRTDAPDIIEAVREELLGLIDLTELNRELEESVPCGPMYDAAIYNWLYWYTDLCVLGVQRSILFNDLDLFVAGEIRNIDFKNACLVERGEDLSPFQF